MIKMSVAIVVWSILSVLSTSDAVAQCGPGCPACSGGTNESMLDPYAIKGTFMVIPDGEEETAIFNVSSTVMPWLELGIGYAMDAERAIWNVKVQVLKEQAGPLQPGVVVGTGSVETGGSDQSGFLQLFKNLDLLPGAELGLSAGFASDLPDLDEGFWLANVSVTFRDLYAPFYSYDGSASHAGMVWYVNDWFQLSGILLEMEEPAISFGITRKLGVRIP